MDSIALLVAFKNFPKNLLAEQKGIIFIES
jgi:hypothetical protein